MVTDGLRIALLVYRGNPHSGGQGVYTRYLARGLVEQGHEVTVFAGQPWPVLDAGVRFVSVASLDLYREPDPFRRPHASELRSPIDLAEYATVCTGGFPEPRTFSWRVRRLLADRRGAFDVVHDNQTFGRSLLGVMADGWPLIGTCHHPITVDRALDLAHADGPVRQLSLRRWYTFLAMQKRVARHFPRILTVSQSSRRDIAVQMRVDPARLAVVPIGVDHRRFRPRADIRRIEGRIMTTASADVPLKGLIPLLEAVAKVRVEHPEAHLVVVGRRRDDGPVARAIADLDLGRVVTFTPGVSDERLTEMFAEASVAVVPSLYEGFSLPAVEAMAALSVAPNEPGALAAAIGRIFDDPALADRLSAQGRRRVLDHFTWEACAAATAEHYHWVIDRHRAGAAGDPPPAC
jgi:glycosyltransferase involved in cell wall biosynthesis